MSETIDFKFNVPVVLTLAFAEGRNVKSQYPGSIRIMRTTTDQRVFFCDPGLEAKIKALAPKTGDSLEITKTERAGSAKGFDWKVSRVGEQKDGTYKIPKADSGSTSQCPEPALVATAKAPIQQPSISPQNITAMPARKEPTESESHCYRLVDLTAATMQYAKEHHGGMVREEDARAIAITVYIQSARMGIIKRRPVQRIGQGTDARRVG